MNKPIASKTPKQIYDRIRQRETAIELLPEGELKEKVRADLARLRALTEVLQSGHQVANRKSLRR